MRVTGPTVRRRNHAWLQMRSLERQAAQLARRQAEQTDSSDDSDSSGAESATSIDSSDDDSDARPTGTRTVRPPRASATARVRVGRGVLRGVPRLATRDDAADDFDSDGISSASESEDSADESTSPPANATPPPAQAPPPAITSAAPAPPPAITSTAPAPPPPQAIVTLTPIAHSPAPDPTATTRKTSPPPAAASSSSASLVTSSPSIGGTMVPVPRPSDSSSSSFENLVTSLLGTAKQTPVASASATNTPSPTVPVTGNTQSGDTQSSDREANESQGNIVSIGSAPKNNLSGGAVAGIVIGVLAFIALLAGAALFWRKRRRDRGLSFLPQTRFRLRDDDESHPPSVTAPLPGKIGGHNPAKTNTQIMDDLMKAAYGAENGTNDMESGVWPAASKEPPQLPAGKQTSAFMDEKAYAALAGPGAPPTPAKPVMRWLDDVRTPTQPNGPEIPPTPDMRGSVGLPMMSGGAVPEPPKTAYFGRDTMTTDTTNTSVRWYG